MVSSAAEEENIPPATRGSSPVGGKLPGLGMNCAKMGGRIENRKSDMEILEIMKCTPRKNIEEILGRAGRGPPLSIYPDVSFATLSGH